MILMHAGHDDVVVVVDVDDDKDASWWLTTRHFIISFLCPEAWEKQMRSAMQHRSTSAAVDEDDGEQVEREVKAPKKMPGWKYEHPDRMCFFLVEISPKSNG